MLTGYLSMGRRPGGDWANCDVGQNGLRYSFKQETVAAQVTSKFSSLHRSSRGTLFGIIIIQGGAKRRHVFEMGNLPALSFFGVTSNQKSTFENLVPILIPYFLLAFPDNLNYI
jgi:hypothetical protein